MVQGDFSVKFRVRSKLDGFRWSLVAVYGAAQPELKPDFLADLVRICGDENLPLLVGGDFNIIRRREEKNNDNFDGRWSMMFNMIIESLNLREIALTGDSLHGPTRYLFRLMKSWIGYLLVWSGNKNIRWCRFMRCRERSRIIHHSF